MTMIDPKYAALYQEAAKDAGTSAALLQPAGDELPARRMKAVMLMTRGMLLENPVSLLDVGCGHGDLCNYLHKDTVYTGMDMYPHILAEAKERYPEKAFIDFTLEDLNEGRITWDVVAALGVVSTLPQGGLPLFAAHLRKLAGRAIVITYYPESYDGMFVKYSDAEIESAFNCNLDDCMIGVVPGDKHRILVIPVKRSASV